MQNQTKSMGTLFLLAALANERSSSKIDSSEQWAFVWRLQNILSLRFHPKLVIL